MTKACLISTLLSLLFYQTTAAAGFEPVKLPDGKQFSNWEQSLTFQRTYHVAQKNTKASDNNPGTIALPWKTISKAARMLRPGERVVVHTGVYRECVRPERGGDGPDKMISYEAAPGESIVIKGSDIWKPKWVKTRYMQKLKDGIVTWEAKLDSRMFEGANTFCIQNFPVQKDSIAWKHYPTFDQRCGQIFVDGVQLKQVSLYWDLQEGDARFWVEENGMTVHVRLPADAKPNKLAFEITTREQVFAPDTRFLNYIRVKGFHMFHAANGVPIPPPQKGLLSSTSGHHWIIEDCEIGYANTLGMDVGGQFWWNLAPGKMQGYHIIRRNHIHHCGISAVSAWMGANYVANENLLIEDNLITDNCWMPVTEHYESAGIKLHTTRNSIIRRNVFLRTAYGSSLWLDGYIFNTRVTRNVFYDTSSPLFGHVFLEINDGPNLVDNNIMMKSTAHGYYQHDVGHTVLIQNLISEGKDCAVHLRHGDPARVNPPYEDDNRVFGNIITGFPKYFQTPNRTSKSDYNLFGTREDNLRGSFIDSNNAKVSGTVMNMSEWQNIGQDVNSMLAQIDVSFDPDKLTLSLKTTAPLSFPAFPDILPQVASIKELLTCDLMGKLRPVNVFTVGPLVNIPLDGTPFSVDPRKIRKNASGL